MKTLIFKLFPVALFGTFTLLGCNPGKPDVPPPPPPPDTTQPELPQLHGASSTNAAKNGLVLFKLLSEGTTSIYDGSIGTDEEVKMAELGSPLKNHLFGCPAIAPKGFNLPFADFLLATQLAYPVNVRGVTRSFIWVDSAMASKDLKSDSALWSVSAMGQPIMSALFSSSEKKFAVDANNPDARKNDILVKIVGLELVFRATGIKDDDLAFPLSSSESQYCLASVKAPTAWKVLRRTLAECKVVQTACAYKDDGAPAKTAPATKQDSSRPAKSAP